MKQIQIDRNVFPPMPAILVGTTIDNKANFMTVGFCACAKLNPPLIAIGINRKKHTAAGINRNGTFSVSLPDKNLLEKTDYCGIVSGRAHDKSRLFTTFKGSLEHAPMIEESPINMECRLVETVDFMHYHLYIGEIVTTFAREDILKDDKLLMEKIKPVIFTTPDNHYWDLGSFLGEAWKVGLKIKNKGDGA